MGTKNEIRKQIRELQNELTDLQAEFDAIKDEDFEWDERAQFIWEHCLFWIKHGILEGRAVALHLRRKAERKKREVGV